MREVEEVIADPETAERRMLIDSDLSDSRQDSRRGQPIKMSDAPEGDRPMRRPPELGEHTEEVLASIGIGANEMERLKRDGVI